MLMKICFRPFGVGVQDFEVDTDELKQKGEKLYEDAKERVKSVSFISLGLAVVVAEVATRHAANTLTTAANKVADVHDVLAAKRVELGR